MAQQNHYWYMKKVGMHAYFGLAFVSYAADGNSHSQSLISKDEGGGGEGRQKAINRILLCFSLTVEFGTIVDLLYHARENGLR